MPYSHTICIVFHRKRGKYCGKTSRNWSGCLALSFSYAYTTSPFMHIASNIRIAPLAQSPRLLESFSAEIAPADFVSSSVYSEAGKPFPEHIFLPVSTEAI